MLLQLGHELIVHNFPTLNRCLCLLQFILELRYFVLLVLLFGSAGYCSLGDIGFLGAVDGLRAMLLLRRSRSPYTLFECPLEGKTLQI